MKWLSILMVAGTSIILLWKFGLVEEFLGPWAAWGHWIGYFGM